jgi:hypothetical protein
MSGCFRRKADGMNVAESVSSEVVGWSSIEGRAQRQVR